MLVIRGVDEAGSTAKRVLNALLACCTAVQVPEEHDARRVRLEIEDVSKIKADFVTAAVWMHQTTLKGVVDCLAHAAAIQTAWGVIFRLPEGCSMVWICKEAAYHVVHPKVPDFLQGHA